MKNPHVPLRVPKWPFWAGDGALVLLVFFLVWKRGVALDSFAFAGAVIAIALAFLFGALPYLIEWLSQRTVILGEEARASGTLRAVSERSEALLERARSLHDETSKCLLQARQVPDRIESAVEAMRECLEARETLELDQLREERDHLRAQEQANLLDQEQRLRKVCKAIGEASDRLESLLGRMEAAGALLQQSEVGRRTETGPVLPPPDSGSPVGRSGPPEAEPAGGVVEEDSLPKAKGNSPPRPAAGRARTRKPPSDQAEIWEGAAVEAEPGSVVPVEGIRLEVDALVGIANRIYLRGDGEGLSGESGVPLEPVGIGRWFWSNPEALLPVTVSLWLNDKVPAKGGEFLMEPGRCTRVRPVFAEP